MKWLQNEIDCLNKKRDWNGRKKRADGFRDKVWSFTPHEYLIHSAKAPPEVSTNHDNHSINSIYTYGESLLLLYTKHEKKKIIAKSTNEMSTCERD